jgi:two-component system, NarL family, sensor histidine kinase DevS
VRETLGRSTRLCEDITAEGRSGTRPVDPVGQEQLRAVIEAARGIHRARSLDTLLREVVTSAVALAGARYGALGVIDPSGEHLEQFITVGIDDETRALIGNEPRGQGILGALIRDAQPLRLSDMSEDPRSSGFPPGHPPMKSFLGVPIVLRGHAFGNLYLTEKREGEFTDQDRELVELLASQAAVAVENARLYDASRRWTRQLDSLNEVGTALMRELELPRLLEVVATRLRELLAARVVLIDLLLPDGRLRVEGAAGENAERLLGMVSPDGSKSHHVLSRGRSERVDSALEDPEIHPEGEAQLLDLQSGLWVPLALRGEMLGVIAVADKLGRDPRFSDEDVRLAEAFATRAAGAVALTRRVSRDTVRAMLQAQEAERSRLSRDLHDQTGQALAALLLGLSAARRAETLDEARAALFDLDGLVREALADVRTIAVQLRPAALDELGLAAALERLASTTSERQPFAVTVTTTLGHGSRLPAEIETAVYRIVQEALSNATKHSRASRIDISVVARADAVVATVEDDGDGFDPATVHPDRLGLAGMRERAALHNGHVHIETQPGGGTVVRAELRLEP